jgi:hypothetical protein
LRLARVAAIVTATTRRSLLLASPPGQERNAVTEEVREPATKNLEDVSCCRSPEL